MMVNGGLAVGRAAPIFHGALVGRVARRDTALVRRAVREDVRVWGLGAPHAATTKTLDRRIGARRFVVAVESGMIAAVLDHAPQPSGTIAAISVSDGFLVFTALARLSAAHGLYSLCELMVTKPRRAMRRSRGLVSRREPGGTRRAFDALRRGMHVRHTDRPAGHLFGRSRPAKPTANARSGPSGVPWRSSCCGRIPQQ